jgi:hypothetical protein
MQRQRRSWRRGQKEGAMTRDADEGFSGHVWLLWTARVLGTLFVALFIFVGVSESLDPEAPTPTQEEWFHLALFPIGVCAGHVLGWWRPLVGGVLSVACLATFFVVMAVAGNGVHDTSAFYIVAVPSYLYILYGLLVRRHRG